MDVRGLFDAHHDELYAYVARMTGDADLAADIAQEAFIRLVQRPPADDNLRAWLFKVATNLARDHARVRSRRLELIRASAGSLPVADPPAPPDAAVHADADRRRARQALEALSERERTMLLLRQEGFSHREIAEAVGTTTQAVGSLLARALRRFGERLSRQARAAPREDVGGTH